MSIAGVLMTEPGMDAKQALERLLAEGVAIWLDAEGKLRIDRQAPEELKDLVRQHKSAIIQILKAQDVMNRSGVRLVRLPLGGFALAKPPGSLPEEVVAAIRTLRLDHLPLVHNDEGGRWMPYGEWRRRQPLYDPKQLEQWLKEREAEEQARLRRGRRKSA